MPEAAILVAGVTCSGSGLTVSVAVTLVVPRPVSEFVKVIVVGPYVPAARPLAFAFTVKVTVFAEGDAIPEVDDAVSQFGRPEIE